MSGGAYIELAQTFELMAAKRLHESCDLVDLTGCLSGIIMQALGMRKWLPMNFTFKSSNIQLSIPVAGPWREGR